MLRENQKKDIEDIISKITCSKDFICYKSDFKNLCKARDMGLTDYVDCLGEDSGLCEYSLPFGDGFFCRCPLRVYIAKRLYK